MPDHAPNRMQHTSVVIYTLPGLTARGRWRSEGFRSRANHMFLWLTRGQCRATLGVKTRGLGPNSLLFVPAGTVQALSFSKTALGYGVFLPQGVPVPVPFQPALIKARSIFEQGRLTGYLEQIMLESQSLEAGSEHAVESYLTLLSVWIERNQISNDWQGQQTADRAAEIATRFADRLEKEMANTHAVGDYAQQLGISPAHLSRVSVALFGKPASSFIQARLVLQGQLLLADTNHTITDIAKGLGFGSAAYFTRLFKAHSGLSPREFRLREKTKSVLPKG